MYIWQPCQTAPELKTIDSTHARKRPSPLTTHSCLQNHRRKAALAHEWWCKWGTFPKGFLRHARCSRAALSPHALCCDHATTFSHQFPFLSALLLDLYLGSQSTCWSHVGPKCLSPRPHCIISTSLVVGVMLYFSGACLPQWWWWCGGRTWSLKMDLVSKWKPRWHFGGSDGS